MDYIEFSWLPISYFSISWSCYLLVNGAASASSANRVPTFQVYPQMRLSDTAWTGFRGRSDDPRHGSRTCRLGPDRFRRQWKCRRWHGGLPDTVLHRRHNRGCKEEAQHTAVNPVRDPTGVWSGFWNFGFHDEPEKGYPSPVSVVLICVRKWSGEKICNWGIKDYSNGIKGQIWKNGNCFLVIPNFCRIDWCILSTLL